MGQVTTNATAPVPSPLAPPAVSTPAPAPVPLPTPRPKDLGLTGAQLDQARAEQAATGSSPDLDELRKNLDPNAGILRLGSRGDRVAVVQRLLGMTGKDVDKRYGVKTAAAVRAFQQKQHLRVDGLAGQETLGRLKLNPQGAAVDANTLSNGSSITLPTKTDTGDPGVKLTAAKDDKGVATAQMAAPPQAITPTTVEGHGNGQTVVVPTANGSGAIQLTGGTNKANGFNGAAGEHQIITMDPASGGVTTESTPATVIDDGKGVRKTVTATGATTSEIHQDPGMYETMANWIWGAPQTKDDKVVKQTPIPGGYRVTTDGGGTHDETRTSVAMDQADAERIQMQIDMAKRTMDPKLPWWDRWMSGVAAGEMGGGL